MSDQEEERTGQGCAAFVNLIISLVVLVLLVYILIPDIEVPDWAKQFKNIKLISKREAVGPVLTFTENPWQQAQYLLIINERLGNSSLPDIIENRKIQTDQSLRLTYKNIQSKEILWEKNLENIPSNLGGQLKFTFDYSTIYFVTQETLKAINRNTGNEAWSLELNDGIHPECEDCLRLFSKSQILLVLSQDRMLHGIHLRDGRVLWKVRLNDPNSQGEPLYAFEQSLGVIDKINNQANAPRAFYLLDVLNGQVKQKINLSNGATNNPIWLADEKVYHWFSKNPGETVLECFSLKSAKRLWAQAINTRVLPSLDFIRQSKNTWQLYWLEPRDLFISLAEDTFLHKIIAVNLSNGAIREILNSEDYELRFVDANRKGLLLHAYRTRGSAKNELWYVDKVSQKIYWKFSLQNSEYPPLDKPSLAWAAKLRNDQVIALEKNEGEKTVRAYTIELVTGRVLEQKNVSIRSPYWNGIAWTGNKGFISARDVYSLHLDSLTLSTEWP